MNDVTPMDLRADEVEGCTDCCEACNYFSAATDDDGSCTYASEHYDCDGECLGDADNDGVCDPLEISGCTDPTACNYVAEATDDDGSCAYAESNYDCDGQCLNDTDADGICDELELPGCQDEQAANFNPYATDEDGSCFYIVMGCTDDAACNYDPSANQNDGSCVAPEFGYGCDGLWKMPTGMESVTFEAAGCQIEFVQLRPDATESGYCHLPVPGYDATACAWMMPTAMACAMKTRSQAARTRMPATSIDATDDNDYYYPALGYVTGLA